jgi:rubrerythrin
MNMKLFASTFVLIFLAELGDKTQLAALAQSVNGRWTVFLAASSALVLSTLIAVLIGDALARAIPASYIKIAAGILFLVFGVMMLRSAFAGEKVPERAAARPGMLATVALRIAADFERAAAADYCNLAKLAKDERLRALLLALETEEQEHLSHILSAELRHGEAQLPAARPDLWPQMVELTHDVAGSEDFRLEVSNILRHAIQHEEATARFYHAVASEAGLPALRGIFAALASEEDKHAVRLRELLNP